MKDLFNLKIYLGLIGLFIYQSSLLIAQPGLTVEQGNGVNSLNGGYAQLGTPNSLHIAIDRDDIQAKNSHLYSRLELNYYGGDVSLGNDVLFMDRYNKRIGINTRTPDGPLDIDFDAGGSLIAGTPSGQGPGWIHFTPNGISRWDAYAGDSFYRIRNIDKPFGYEVSLTLSDFGHLGIRVLNPHSDLHIKQAHTLNVYGGSTGIRLEHASNSNHWTTLIDNNNDYALAYNDTLKVWISDTDGNYNKSSDQRVKQDIHPIHGVLDLVKKLNPVTYKHRSHADAKLHSWGFIAQEVESLFPDFVSTKEGLKGLAYDNFAVLAIKAIQEQQTIIEEKNAEMVLLRDRLSKIEAHLGLAQDR